MISDPIDRLPTREEVGAAIVETARRARRLRSLYRLLGRVDDDREAVESLLSDVTAASLRYRVLSDQEDRGDE